MKRKAIILTTIIVLATAGGSWYYMSSSSRDKVVREKSEQNESESSNRKEGSASTTTNEADQQKQFSNEVKVAEDKAVRTGTKRTITPTLTGVDVIDQGYKFGTVISDATSGTCTLKLTRAGQQSVVRTAPIQMATSYYTCAGFTIPGQDFPSGGQWKAQIFVDGANLQGSSNVVEFEVSL